jgi:hypothetical protein
MLELGDMISALPLVVHPGDMTPAAETAVRNLHAYLLAMDAALYEDVDAHATALILATAPEWGGVRELAEDALSELKRNHKV